MLALLFYMENKSLSWRKNVKGLWFGQHVQNSDDTTNSRGLVDSNACAKAHKIDGRLLLHRASHYLCLKHQDDQNLAEKTQRTHEQKKEVHKFMNKTARPDVKDLLSFQVCPLVTPWNHAASFSGGLKKWWSILRSQPQLAWCSQMLRHPTRKCVGGKKAR